MRSNENKERIEGYLYGLDDGNGRDALTKRQSGANSKNPGRHRKRKEIGCSNL